MSENNSADSNGWSKYQIMVLETLKEHTVMFKELMVDINDIKKQTAVDAVLYEKWKEDHYRDINQLQKQINEVKNIKEINLVQKQIVDVKKDIQVINNKVDGLISDKNLSKKINLKIKGIWAGVGAVTVFLIDIGLRIFENFIKP